MTDDPVELIESQTWDDEVLRSSPFVSAIQGTAPTSLEDTDPIAQILVLAHAASSAAGLELLLKHATPQWPALLQAAANTYSGRHELIQPQSPHYTWLPLRAFSLNEQGPLFAYRIADALHKTRALGLLAETPRQHLTNLLFQPLQNCLFYGRQARSHSQLESFSGLVLRIVPSDILAGPSKEAYKASLDSPSPKFFLEAIVHDDGPGIAAHFFASTNSDEGSVYNLPIAREWSSLVRAFERHISSRPRHMERRVNQEAFEPGIGLFAVLSALRALNGYMEVRCGRLRLYRSLNRSTPFRADEPLLYPHRFQEKPLPLIAGTILRFFLPLATSV